jgi:hypothetical protein
MRLQGIKFLRVRGFRVLRFSRNSFFEISSNQGFRFSRCLDVEESKGFEVCRNQCFRVLKLYISNESIFQSFKVCGFKVSRFQGSRYEVCRIHDF